MLDRGSATFVIALVSLIAGIGAASNRLPVGSVTAVNGTVTLTRKGIAKPVYYGDGVEAGDQLAASSDGLVTITLADKTQLELTGSSTVLLAGTSSAMNGPGAITRATLIDGTLNSIVRSAPGTPPNFELSTSNAIAKASDGSYRMEYQRDQSRKGYPDCREFTDVSVYNGLVEVSNPAIPGAIPVKVQKGQKTVIPCGLAVASATSITGPTGMSAAAMAALGTTGVAGIGGLLAAILSGGSSGAASALFTPAPRFPASASR
jgi:hypothetical protein